jgi:NTP pyrophosphatase (non-canonical NTP hydrolase)
MTESTEGLKLSTYQAQALRADRRPELSLAFPLLGLFGEVGSLLSVVKKKQRDRAAYLGYSPHVIEELGDVLWYFTVVAARGGVSLSDVGNNIYRGFSDWKVGGGRSMKFRALQSARQKPRKKPTVEFENTLLDMAGEIGVIVSNYQAGRLSGNQDALRGGLLAVMRTLVKAADEAGVTLERAAEDNLKKIFDRWPTKRVYPSPFDKKALVGEQLPRKLTIDIFERKLGGKVYVFQQCNGVNIGDRLTDNSVEPDDYRFHDVFRYAYGAVLTWSPRRISASSATKCLGVTAQFSHEQSSSRHIDA